MLCDTNGGSMPHEVGELVRVAMDLMETVGPGVSIGVHCHNDCSLAVANSLAAVRAGATQVQVAAVSVRLLFPLARPTMWPSLRFSYMEKVHCSLSYPKPFLQQEFP